MKTLCLFITRIIFVYTWLFRICLVILNDFDNIKMGKILKCFLKLQCTFYIKKTI